MSRSIAPQEVKQQGSLGLTEGRSMPPLRSLSSRMIGMISSSSATLQAEEERKEEEDSSSGTPTAADICHPTLHGDDPKSRSTSPCPSSMRHRRTLSTRNSLGEARRRSSLFSMGSAVLSDLSSVADEMMSSLAREAAETTGDNSTPPLSIRTISDRRSQLSKRRSLQLVDVDGFNTRQEPPTTTSTCRPINRRASYHYPGNTSRINRRSSCSSVLSAESDRSEAKHRLQISLQTPRRRHSNLYDIDDEHDDEHDDDDDDVHSENGGATDDDEVDIAIHRPGTSLASYAHQESERDLDFFDEDQVVVVDGLVTLSSSPNKSVATSAA